MKIAFLNPPFKARFSRASRSPAVTKGGTLYYPLWLAYAAGVCEAAGFTVQLIDAPADGLGLSSVVDTLKNFQPDLLVVDTSTASIVNDVSIAGALKARFPGLFSVLVGTHPSALPEETLGLDAGIDAVAVGEYDYTIRDLAHALQEHKDLSQVKGLVFRKDATIAINPAREKIEDLDALPFVSSVYKKHLNYRNYFFAAASYPMVMIITGRGCPFRCFFCVYPQVLHGRRYRCRSPENVIAEFEYIHKNFPHVKEIGIEDDCFTADKQRVHTLCELLIKIKSKMKWYCNVRGDLEYDLLRLMKRAGCRLVTVGFESGCQNILDRIPKATQLEHYYRFAEDARRAGILIHGCIMLGNPGDSKETLAQSYAFAKKINCDSMQFYPLYVYPGTEAFAWADAHGYLKTKDFSQWVTGEGLHNCILDLPQLSSGELADLSNYYLKKYHLRPGYLAMKMWQALCQPAEGYRTFKAAKFFLTRHRKTGSDLFFRRK
jgi:radical SAM superfamily enzyme YgiQ (UPF0313 family)